MKMMLEPQRRRSENPFVARCEEPEQRCSRCCVIDGWLASAAARVPLSQASGLLLAAGHSSSTGSSRRGGEAVFTRRSARQNCLLLGELLPPLAVASSRGLLPAFLVDWLSREVSLGGQVDAAGGASMINAGKSGIWVRKMDLVVSWQAEVCRRVLGTVFGSQIQKRSRDVKMEKRS